MPAVKISSAGKELAGVLGGWKGSAFFVVGGATNLRWQSGEDEINGEREGDMLSGGGGGGGHGQE